MFAWGWQNGIRRNRLTHRLYQTYELINQVKSPRNYIPVAFIKMEIRYLKKSNTLNIWFLRCHNLNHYLVGTKIEKTINYPSTDVMFDLLPINRCHVRSPTHQPMSCSSNNTVETFWKNVDARTMELIKVNYCMQRDKNRKELLYSICELSAKYMSDMGE